MTKKLIETKKDAKTCLERLLRELGKEYDSDVAQEFTEAVFSIGKKNLMEKEKLGSILNNI